MSATRDKSQKIAFVYSNLYSLYRKGKSAAQQAEVPPISDPVAVTPRGLTTSQVLKAEAVKPAQIETFRPTEFIERRLQARTSESKSDSRYEPILNESAERIGIPVRKLALAPVAITQETTKVQAGALEGLRKNLTELEELHERLRFMLQELEDLVKS